MQGALQKVLWAVSHPQPQVGPIIHPPHCAARDTEAQDGNWRGAHCAYGGIWVSAPVRHVFWQRLSPTVSRLEAWGLFLSALLWDGVTCSSIYAGFSPGRRENQEVVGSGWWEIKACCSGPLPGLADSGRTAGSLASPLLDRQCLPRMCPLTLPHEQVSFQDTIGVALSLPGGGLEADKQALSSQYKNLEAQVSEGPSYLFWVSTAFQAQEMLW